MRRRPGLARSRIPLPRSRSISPPRIIQTGERDGFDELELTIPLLTRYGAESLEWIVDL